MNSIYNFGNAPSQATPSGAPPQQAGAQQPQPQEPQEQSSSATPKTMYCLKCRQHCPVNGVQMVRSEFTSKNGNKTGRNSWQGTCGSCGKTVKRFAPSSKKK